MVSTELYFIANFSAATTVRRRSSLLSAHRTFRRRPQPTCPRGRRPGGSAIEDLLCPDYVVIGDPGDAERCQDAHHAREDPTACVTLTESGRVPWVGLERAPEPMQQIFDRDNQVLCQVRSHPAE
jgi:hypothetical protein